jgi:hypothetical protein
MKLESVKSRTTSGSARTQVLLDYLFFYYTQTAFTGFGTLGEKRGKAFIAFYESLVAAGVVQMLWPALKDEAQGKMCLDKVVEMMHGFAAVSSEFTPTREGSSLAGTTLWELGKRISQSATGDLDGVIATMVGQLAFAGLQFINARDTLSKIKWQGL